MSHPVPPPPPPPVDPPAPPRPPEDEEPLELENVEVETIPGLQAQVATLNEIVAETAGKVGMYRGAAAQMQVKLARAKRTYEAERAEWQTERQALLEQVGRLTAEAGKPAPGVKPSTRRRRESVASDRAVEEAANDAAEAIEGPAEPAEPVTGA